MITFLRRLIYEIYLAWIESHEDHVDESVRRRYVKTDNPY